VEWQSITTGDEDGLDLRLNHLEGAHLRFTQRPGSASTA
jgi:hypothetical protein